MDIKEKLKNPTVSYTSFTDWDEEYTAHYLETTRKTADDLMFDKYYNTIRNQTWGQFVAVKNGETPKPITLHSDDYWKNREALEKNLEVIHAGKTPDQVIQESMEHTKGLIQQEKATETKEASSRIAAMKAIFELCNPRKSNRIK